MPLARILQVRGAGRQIMWNDILKILRLSVLVAVFPMLVSAVGSPKLDKICTKALAKIEKVQIYKEKAAHKLSRSLSYLEKKLLTKSEKELLFGIREKVVAGLHPHDGTVLPYVGFTRDERILLKKAYEGIKLKIRKYKLGQMAEEDLAMKAMQKWLRKSEVDLSFLDTEVFPRQPKPYTIISKTRRNLSAAALLTLFLGNIAIWTVNGSGVLDPSYDVWTEKTIMSINAEDSRDDPETYNQIIELQNYYKLKDELETNQAIQNNQSE
jgi:hypothetical protein